MGNIPALEFSSRESKSGLGTQFIWFAIFTDDYTGICIEESKIIRSYRLHNRGSIGISVKNSGVNKTYSSKRFLRKTKATKQLYEKTKGSHERLHSDIVLETR